MKCTDVVQTLHLAMLAVTSVRQSTKVATSWLLEALLAWRLVMVVKKTALLCVGAIHVLTELRYHSWGCGLPSIATGIRFLRNRCW